MTLQELLKFVHVLFVIVWLGGGVWTQLYAVRARAASDPAAFAGLMRQAAWAGNRVFLPSSILVLVSGVWMVLEGPLRFEDVWVALGIVGFLVTAVTGSAFLGPAAKKLVAAIDEHGATSEPVNAHAGRILTVLRVDLLVLVLVVLDMVVKPGAA